MALRAGGRTVEQSWRLAGGPPAWQRRTRKDAPNMSGPRIGGGRHRDSDNSADMGGWSVHLRYRACIFFLSFFSFFCLFSLSFLFLSFPFPLQPPFSFLSLYHFFLSFLSTPLFSLFLSRLFFYFFR